MDMVQDQHQSIQNLPLSLCSAFNVEHLNPTKPFGFNIVYMNPPSIGKHHHCYAPPQYSDNLCLVNVVM
jgi:hypothetical protein